MATNVTVTRAYVHDKYYEEGGSFSQQSTIAKVGASMSWIGSTANAVGTYGGTSAITAQQFLRFIPVGTTAGELIVGTPTEAYGTNLFSATIGGIASGDVGQLELVGNTTTNTKLGGISWHNVASIAADKRVAEIYASRDDDDDVGSITVVLGDAAGGGVNTAAFIAHDEHAWYVSGSPELRLDTALAPYFNNGLDLGKTDRLWNYIYASNIRDTALAGSGSRIVVTDADGDLSAGAADNSTNWNTAYTHSQVTTGNPHSVAWTELSGVRSGITLSGFDDDLTYNNYSHPNHTGHVTSTGDGATVVTVSAITGQTATSTLTGTDEILVSDAGVIRRTDLINLITGQTATTSLVSTDEIVVSDAGAMRRADISVLQTYMQDNLSFGTGYTHPNHTGHVTSTGDGATVVTVSAITGQTATSSLISTDELLVNDGGAIRRADISVLQTYMQNNLSFSSSLWSSGSGYIYPATSTNSVRIALGEGYQFGDGDSYFYESTDDTVYCYVGANPIWRWQRVASVSGVYSHAHVYPSADSAWDFGSTSLRWATVYGTDINIENEASFNRYWKIIDLPAFSMGSGGITDEYLVLNSLWDDGSSAPDLDYPIGLNGRIIFQRGGVSSGNNMTEIALVLQTAYNTDLCYSFEVRGDPIFTAIDQIAIDGVEYWALKARTGGGGKNLTHQFVGEIYNDKSDTNFLTRVRLSDANVTLTTASVHLPHYTNFKGDITFGTGATMNIDGDRLMVGGTTNTLSPIPNAFVVAASHTVGEYGAFSAKGYQTSNTEQVGSYYFQNFGSASTGGIIGEISCFRKDDNDAGEIKVYITDSGGTKDIAWNVHSTEQVWSINGINELVLSSTSLSPSADAGLYLGDSTHAFSRCYTQSIYLSAGSPTSKSYKLVHNLGSDEIVSFETDSSDIRFKHDRKPIENPTAKILSLNGVTFQYNELGHKITGQSMEGRRASVIAQDLLAAKYPEAVFQIADTGYYDIDDRAVCALLVEGFKEHDNEIESLKKEVLELKKLINSNRKSAA